MIEVNVSLTDGASPMLLELLSGLTGARASEISRVSGIAARNAAIEYHRSFEDAKRWRGTKYLGPGPGGSSFGEDVAVGWFLESHTAGGATIENGARYYRHKVEGGTITPKRGRFLTIPLVQEAKGRTVASYRRDTGKKLFRPKGKNVLMESTGKGTVRSVYALVTSVTQGPWRGALPPDELIAAAYTDQYREELIEITM